MILPGDTFYLDSKRKIPGGACCCYFIGTHNWYMALPKHCLNINQMNVKKIYDEQGVIVGKANTFKYAPLANPRLDFSFVRLNYEPNNYIYVEYSEEPSKVEPKKYYQLGYYNIDLGTGFSPTYLLYQGDLYKVRLLRFHSKDHFLFVSEFGIEFFPGMSGSPMLDYSLNVVGMYLGQSPNNQSVFRGLILKNKYFEISSGLLEFF